MATLADIRARLAKKAQESKNTSGDGASFPFWDTPVGQTSIIRLLPDGDEDNEYFWRERLVIKLPFDGILGGDNREVTVQVPSLEMYGLKCPIKDAIKGWWNTDRHEEARTYYRKKSYVMQGFVVSSPIEETETPSNPIRRFVFGESIYKLIFNTLMDTDIEDLVIDYDRGRDFRINVQKQGDFRSYGTSSFTMKTRPLSDSERAAIQTHGLHRLVDALPARPTDEQIVAIQEMFEASVAGLPYDADRWGNAYRPAGMRAPDSPITAAARARVQAAAAQASAAQTVSGAGMTTAEILARVGRNAI